MGFKSGGKGDRRRTLIFGDSNHALTTFAVCFGLGRKRHPLPIFDFVSICEFETRFSVLLVYKRFLHAASEQVLRREAFPNNHTIRIPQSCLAEFSCDSIYSVPGVLSKLTFYKYIHPRCDFPRSSSFLEVLGREDKLHSSPEVVHLRFGHLEELSKFPTSFSFVDEGQNPFSHTVVCGKNISRNDI